MRRGVRTNKFNTRFTSYTHISKGVYPSYRVQMAVSASTPDECEDIADELMLLLEGVKRTRVWRDRSWYRCTFYCSFDTRKAADKDAIRLNRIMIALEIEELQEQLRELDNLIV